LNETSTNDALQKIHDRLEQIERHLRDLKQLEQLLPALVRRTFLSDLDLPAPFDLAAERFGLVSQNGEDGIIVALFKRIGMTGRRFVEIGCGFNGGNSGFLARECGWSGLMVDAQEGAIARIAAKYAGLPVTPLARSITRENLNSTLRDFDCTGEIDLVSIDVDGVDFWLWDALDACRPRLLVIEYNYLFGPTASVTVPYDPAFDLERMPSRSYRGASLEALARLGRRKGYRLVACERVNAFLVRDDLGPGIPAIDAAAGYQPPDNKGTSDVFHKIATKVRLPLIPVGEDGTPGMPMPATAFAS
jgi:hypothetical protein